MNDIFYILKLIMLNKIFFCVYFTTFCHLTKALLIKKTSIVNNFLLVLRIFEISEAHNYICQLF